MRHAALVALVIGTTLACVPSASAASLTGLTGQFQVGFPAQTVTFLTEIRYQAAAGEVNIIDYASTVRRGASVCSPFPGPGECIADVGVGQEAHHFLDGRGRLWSASGWCKVVHPALGTCHGPSGPRLLTITLNLFDGNDEVRVAVEDSFPMRRFQVSGSAGNDVIRLVDHSHAGEAFGVDARERIFCGTGSDQVITTNDAIVNSDCEQVTRVP